MQSTQEVKWCYVFLNWVFKVNSIVPPDSFATPNQPTTINLRPVRVLYASEWQEEPRTPYYCRCSNYTTSTLVTNTPFHTFNYIVKCSLYIILKFLIFNLYYYCRRETSNYFLASFISSSASLVIVKSCPNKSLIFTNACFLLLSCRCLLFAEW